MRSHRFDPLRGRWWPLIALTLAMGGLGCMRPPSSPAAGLAPGAGREPGVRPPAHSVAERTPRPRAPAPSFLLTHDQRSRVVANPRLSAKLTSPRRGNDPSHQERGKTYEGDASRPPPSFRFVDNIAQTMKQGSPDFNPLAYNHPLFPAKTW